MKRYVALLRGVNVGARNKVPMAALRDTLAALGFEDVATYVQSGNVVFDSPATAEAKLVDALETAIRRRFRLDVPVILRAAEQLTRLPAANPFLRGRRDPSTLHVTFLGRPPSAAARRALPVRVGRDELAAHGREVFLCCPDGYGRSKLTNAWMEQHAAAPATTRNWRTVLAITELATA